MQLRPQLPLTMMRIVLGADGLEICEPHEVERGFVLTCQSFPVGDAVTVDFDA